MADHDTGGATTGRDGEGAEDAASPTWWERVRFFLGVLVLFLVIRTFVLQTFVIISGSMEGTLLVGDMLVANRLAVGPRIPGTQMHLPGYSDPTYGDVVVFDPHHEEGGMRLVKRLVGLPGDTLRMRAGLLERNGRAVPEPYAVTPTSPDGWDPEFAWQSEHVTPEVDPTTYRPTRDEWGPLVVPDGHYFLLGDNRGASRDSRYWGPLATWRVEAQASFVYFSYNRGSFRPFPAIREIRWGRLGRGIGRGPPPGRSP